MIILMGFFFGGGEIVNTPQIEPVTKEIKEIEPMPAATPASTSTPAPTETAYPKPSNTPDLRPYLIDKTHDIWHARDPPSYITPDNEWVKYYARQLYIDLDGRFRYKNEKVPLVADTKGNIIEWIDRPLLNNYKPDSNYPDNDYWAMPDYYLYNNMTDDCDGWGIAVTSILLSGQISIKQDGKFVKQIVPSKTVIGYFEDKRDLWVEYKVYNKTFITTTGSLQELTITHFFEQGSRRMTPVFEFDDTHFGVYKEW